ncbi:MAG: hypothetical protein A2136_10750 [Chloroflexi bacterium RBG_16_54_11]|nr:MAG: hypothetical protein A2136_10750 [Chloroflexi bacterium RBG_16_54_11]
MPANKPDNPNRSDVNYRALVINFAIEMLLYAILVVAYFFIVLRLLNGVLTRLFQNNLTLYALIGLGLVVAQGVFLEAITSFILDRLNIQRLE